MVEASRAQCGQDTSQKTFLFVADATLHETLQDCLAPHQRLVDHPCSSLASKTCTQEPASSGTSIQVAAPAQNTTFLLLPAPTSIASPSTCRFAEHSVDLLNLGVIVLVEMSLCAKGLEVDRRSRMRHTAGLSACHCRLLGTSI
ncbi:hypothetical protein VTI74DRAFT_4143 [Chaetomium olivicolor]